jgi:glucosamine-6-phosphate deaminase
MEVVIQANTDAATELVARIVAREVQTNPRPVLGLATGRTMEAVYARLVQMHRNERLDFSACRTFNLDEYVGLAGSDRHSYRHYMDQHFFRQVNIDLRNTHLPDGAAADLRLECEKYERLFAEAGGIGLQLLGIGHSGHIGFNEPPSPPGSRTRVVALAATTIRQNTPIFGRADKVPRSAITMGVGTILDCRRCVLLATGEDKAEIIARAVEGPLTSMISASALQLHPDCTVALDEAAAGRLQKSDYYRSIYNSEPKWDWFRKLPTVVLGSGRNTSSLEDCRLEPAP